jgi:hypothetical protein
VHQSQHNVANRTDKYPGIVYNAVMAGLPNQISSERVDLRVQIEKCRRLAGTLTDEQTIQKLLALAAEYELRLNQTSDI